MYEERGVGLAAPQLGVSLRVFTYHVDDVVGHLVNPELRLSSEQQDGPEGCLSLPGLEFDCLRAQDVVAIGQNMYGDPVTIEGSDLLARCIQHETDHLDGVLFIDRLDQASMAHQRPLTVPFVREQLGLVAQQVARIKAATDLLVSDLQWMTEQWAADGAAREALEETGVRCRAVDLVGALVGILVLLPLLAIIASYQQHMFSGVRQIAARRDRHILTGAPHTFSC